MQVPFFEPPPLRKPGRLLRPRDHWLKQGRGCARTSLVVLALLAGFLPGDASGAGGTVFAWGYNSFGECNVPAGLNDAVAVACGNYFSIALRANGTVATWGDNSYGLCNVPPTANNLIAISTRGYDCLGLRSDGTLIGWGNYPPPIPPGAYGIVALATGGGHYLALRQDGTLLAWGANNYGQCNLPIEATNIIAVAAGYTHSLVLRKDGQVLAWGEDMSGTTEVPPDATNVVAISCGPDFNLALRADGTAVGWGLDWGGNLPVPANVTNAIAVSAGEMPDFAILRDGSIASWGRDDTGDVDVPAALAPAYAIGAGNLHALGIRVRGAVSLLRQPNSRAVSAGDSILFNVPAIGQVPIAYQWRLNGVPLSGETSAVLLVPDAQSTNAGNYDLVVANGFNTVTSQVATVTVQPAAPAITLQPTGTVASVSGLAVTGVRAKGTEPLSFQWLKGGQTLAGQTTTTLRLTNLTFADAGGYSVLISNSLGQAVSATVPLEVVPVIAWGTNNSGMLTLPFGLTNTIGLVAGQTHALALKSDGTVIGWGDNAWGESTPPSDATNLVAVGVGDQFSLALRGDGTVTAWGGSGGGVVAPSNATNIAAISVAPSYVLLLQRDGSLFNWPWTSLPILPAAATNLVAVAAGWTHCLGVHPDGTLLAWGGSSYGQTTVPATATNIIAVAASGYFSLVLRADGTPLAWGDNSSGQCNIPTGATNIMLISAGPDHALAVREDGTLFVWGDLKSGQGSVPAGLTSPAVVAAGGVYDLALQATTAPWFLNQPITQAVNAGDPLYLHAAAAGAGPLTYQWMLGGTNLPGATHAYLSIADLQAGNQGGYTLVVSNNLGLATSAVATITVLPTAPIIVQPPSSQVSALGGTVTFSVVAKGSEPLTYQWRLNGTALPGATTTSLTISNAQWINTGTYDVVLTNASGNLASTAVTLTFQPTVDAFDLGANNPVYAMAQQPDGKVLVGGTFTTLSGQSRTNLARLNPDGTLDPTFNAPASAAGGTAAVYALAVMPDGRILVGGHFVTLGGQSRTNLARLNPDGSVDPTFYGAAQATWVTGFAQQPDGKVVVIGAFTNFFGLTRTNLARLNADGTLDISYNPRVSGSIVTLALQADNKLLLGGSFTAVSGQARGGLARVNPDGTLDNGFTPSTPGAVDSLVVQPDGRILVGGSFLTLGGQSRSDIARLNPDGTVDPTFNPGANGIVYALALQADGRILAGGTFSTLGGLACGEIGRLNPDGTADLTFNPGASSQVNGLLLQTDARVLVGGFFTTFAGQPRSRLARVPNTGPATQTLVSTPTDLTWLRGGTGPEFWRTTFDASTNGNDWISLGAATYTNGGWWLGGLTLPANATTRARGYTTSGYENSSAWLVEAGSGPPALSSPPVSRTNGFGDTARFSVVGVGTPPLSYQWLKNGVNLADGLQVFGSGTPSLALFGVAGADAGGYSVVISNSSGSVTSAVANLMVLDPLVTVPPVSQVVTAGQSALFSVTAVGTSPLTYQWRHYGANLPGATTSSLALTNVQWADAGRYDVLVGNAFETNASPPATLALAATLDPLNTSASAPVYALAVQSDGGILVGGSFSFLGNYQRVGAGRLLPTGAVDTQFNPAADNAVYALAVQTDGRILLGGIFSSLAKKVCPGLGRVNADGSFDATFTPAPNAEVYALALQPDGKILVGGRFTTLCGQARQGLGRLNADGTLDTAFNPGAGGTVYSLALQPDGKVLVGGTYTNLAGAARLNLGRLNADGSIDPGFTASAGAVAPATASVNCLLLQPDGAILVGGTFAGLCGQARLSLGRLFPDGTLDLGFNPSPKNTGTSPPYPGSVYSLALQADGKILVGGNFSSLGGQARLYFGRINPDGTPDPTLNPGANSYVYALALQADGSLLAGGNFGTFGGQSRAKLARLVNTYAALQNLSFDGTTATWLRDGASPEIWRATLQNSSDGTTWASLGALGRVPGGWQMTSVPAQTNSTLLIRGFVEAGYESGSSWFVEAGFGPPAIRSQPGNWTTNAASVARFNLQAVGSPSLVCQWFKNGLPLSDGGNTSGSQTMNLVLNGVLAGDDGGYYAVITNSFGSLTSAVAALSVVDPCLTSQPASRTNNAGTTATFSTVITGTAPISFQWYKGATALANGGNLLGAQTATLTLSNVLAGDMGGYAVVVSNAVGSLTSAVASLTVIDPVINTPPGSLSVAQGQNASFSVVAAGTTPAYLWRKDGLPLPAATNASLALTNVQRVDAGLYDVVVSNAFGGVTSPAAMLSVNLAGTDAFNPVPNGTVATLAIQPDGKILAGGSFTTLAGQPRSCLGRINADGTLDAGFNPGAVGNDGVYCFGIQPDGRLLVGGAFLSLAGQSQSFYGRLNADATLDASFSLGASAWVTCLLPLADGTILMSGGFGALGGQSHPGLVHLSSAGAVDLNFNPAPNSSVFQTVPQADGKILLTGGFTSLASQARKYLGRLNADGSLDAGFNPGVSNVVFCAVVQPDGRIVMGGSFTNLAGQTRNYLARLNGDGTLDSAFNPSPNNNVFSLALQTDGRIVVGGRFSSLGGQLRARLGRLNPDGTLDKTFDPGADNDVRCLAIQPDGAILLGGLFTTVGGQSRPQIARLVNPDPAAQSLAFDGSSLTWWRSGSSPEVGRVAFESSADGTNWAVLGSGTRVPGGWRLANISLPANSAVRVRGFILSPGNYSSSSWFVETRVQPLPGILAGSGYTNQFVADFFATPGQTVVIEGSTDFIHWTPVQTNTVTTAGAVFFNDPGSANFPARFYRAHYY